MWSPPRSSRSVGCTINTQRSVSIAPQRKTRQNNCQQCEKEYSLKMSSTAGQVIRCKGMLEFAFSPLVPCLDWFVYFMWTVGFSWSFMGLFIFWGKYDSTFNDLRANKVVKQKWSTDHMADTKLGNFGNFVKSFHQ